MKIAILGFGREGQSVYRFLKKEPKLRGLEIWILDRNPKTEVPTQCKKRLGKQHLQHLERFDLVIRSPGVPWNLPELKKARRAGVLFSSLTKIFFRTCPGKIIGVTGTKGKGTTSTLLYEILKAAHKDVYLVGNIGKPALDILPRLTKKSLIVCELSSFQLQDLDQSPPVAVVLETFPDHQDAHPSLAEYYGAKANIARYQKKRDLIYFFKHSAKSAWIAGKSRGKKIPILPEKFTLFKPKDLLVKGEHNFKNATMVSTVATHLGIPKSTILRAVRRFKGLEHRLELVRKLKYRRKRIEFYNDSASTNPHTTAAALRAFQDIPHVLIAGGQDKNLDYKPLRNALHGSVSTGAIILIGENKKKIHKALKNIKTPILYAKTLNEALANAYKEAKKILNQHDRAVVLFSPGATSFDMFQDYRDRGAQFKKIVSTLR